MTGHPPHDVFDSDSAPQGGHLLPADVGGLGAVLPPPPTGRRVRRRPIIATAIGIVVVGLACAGVQVAANLGYDDALVAFDDAADEARSSGSTVSTDITALQVTTDAGTAVATLDSGTFIDAESKADLTAALETATSTLSAANEVVAETLPTAGEKPTWAWELFGESGQLNEDREFAEDLTEDLETAEADLAASETVMQETGAVSLTAAADAAAAFEAAHRSARNLDIIALRTAADQVRATAPVLDGSASSAFSELESAAAAMLVSERAELAEKAGPLQPARLEIEAFARALAPGVLLEFDWSALVNGFGYADSMGGYATWWYADPGYATIELSNSVAEQWPNDRSKALIAHEVGHAISVKCEGMYDDSSQENIEAWATAWAISMGYRDDANGTWAYGAPSQSLIDAAAGCR